jgi:predicted nucleotidyltransferase component of viral defense system
MSRDWLNLYALQDKVLEEISSIESIALGGGTGLNRFITKESIRYSEDLDIFVTESKESIQYQLFNNVNISETSFFKPFRNWW